MCHIVSGDSERYSIASAALANRVHTRRTAAQPGLSGSPRLRSLHAEQPRMSAEARIILDSIIKCHVITRYGVVHSLPAAPRGRYGPSDRLG